MPKLLNVISSVPGIIDDIPISKIRYSSKLLRANLSGIEELVGSIKANGLLQPIVVRPFDTFFEIVAGNRRRKACEVLRWKKVACHIVHLDDKQAFETSLIENLQRETLAPIDEAQAYKAYVADFGWGGVSELAKNIGKSPSYITKKIKLLNLPEDILDSLADMSLNPSVAEELCSLKNPSKQSELADLIIRRHLSMRRARELVKNYSNDYDDCDSGFTLESNMEHSQRTFDKLILVLRIALNNIGGLIGDNEEEEEEWVVREILMHHKNMLHEQIDFLIKERNKLNRRLLSF